VPLREGTNPDFLPTKTARLTFLETSRGLVLRSQIASIAWFAAVLDWRRNRVTAPTSGLRKRLGGAKG
jgi:hypothetical protein